ncbi:hypothetical protein SAMN04488073_2446 [Marinobacter gudaonensis]|uniref:Alpha/beta hydrolase family protein n=1 Tax=Marinobacter gudaonensis TaxID=375760 RepID=A0A1I6H799_9GAMM|nr:hypothetical protein SAMN04488073_2446 [Marinobacter gudaonensis]
MGVLLLTGCSTIPTPGERIARAEGLVSDHGWQSIILDTEPFKVRSFVELNPERQKPLTIYIEGDGLAWKTRTEVSDDPTPTDLMWLRVALGHTSGNTAYLARPCQFMKDINTNCNPSVWTEARFSSEVVRSMNRAITELKRIYHATDIKLVGFSGGGAIAALVAANRDDVVRLITVAGTLDHRVWTDYHNVTPLHASLNPADYWRSLQRVPQFHFIGGRDVTVPKEVAESYISRFPVYARPELEVVEGFGHTCCWEKERQKLYSVVVD